jgi:type IV secretory pathway TrbD component
MNILFPAFTGQTRIASPAAVFLEGMKGRLESGLLMGRPHRRSHYAVIRHAQRELAFKAADFVTAINVGLNEVILRTGADRNVEYSVSYVRWAAYVVGLGACLGIAFLFVFLLWDIQAEIGRYAFVADPALNRSIGFALFWGFVLFWTLVWPWILIIMYRPFARKLLERIIGEVDMAAQHSLARKS